jgi:G3E family GTPase
VVDARVCPAGKTTLLRYLLENSKEKIGCVVNDVASINIDAKLVRNDRNRGKGAEASSSTADLADTIELANGCACKRACALTQHGGVQQQHLTGSSNCSSSN